MDAIDRLCSAPCQSNWADSYQYVRTCYDILMTTCMEFDTSTLWFKRVLFGR